jgi:hypothetical protein
MYQVKRRLKRHAVAYPCAHQNEPIDCHENRQSVLST